MVVLALEFRASASGAWQPTGAMVTIALAAGQQFYVYCIEIPDEHQIAGAAESLRLRVDPTSTATLANPGAATRALQCPVQPAPIPTPTPPPAATPDPTGAVPTEPVDEEHNGDDTITDDVIIVDDQDVDDEDVDNEDTQDGQPDQMVDPGASEGGSPADDDAHVIELG